MRVFVSSTVFDLIDVRAEIASQLSSLGIVPVMSDDKLSDFQVQPHEDSIATCLINLASCDEVILVLDRRYGPKLGKAGFEDISATHLEYRHAIEQKKPTHVFVRDRTEADHGIWKKNKNQDSFKLNWVRNEDFGIFELLDEHRSLQAKSNKSNWFDTFSSSIDLKAAVKLRFLSRILPQRLVDALQRNEFPLIDAKADASIESNGVKTMIKGVVKLKNVGGVPAFGLKVYWDEGETKIHDVGIFASRVSKPIVFLCELPGTERFLIVEYESPIGVSVYERYKVVCKVIDNRLKVETLVSGCRRVEQKYRHAEGIQIKIDD